MLANDFMNEFVFAITTLCKAPGKKAGILPAIIAVCLLLGSAVGFAAPADDATAWQDSDIGEVGATGSFSENNGMFTVTGSGNDIWNRADAFHFVYQTLPDDGTLTVHVAKFDATKDWSKAGLMVRETLAPGSVYGLVFASKRGGASFQCRTETGGQAQRIIDAPKLFAPCWLRLIRKKDVITAYCSKNASPGAATWVKMGSIEISMSNPVYVGLAVCSQKAETLCEAQFNYLTLMK